MVNAECRTVKGCISEERPEGFPKELAAFTTTFTLVSIHSTTRVLRGTVLTVDFPFIILHFDFCILTSALGGLLNLEDYGNPD